ncbi:MAG: lipoyl(octanoyl) transferase LipB [Terracidiphilus sp.]
MTAMIQYLYLGRVPYDDGLRLQAEIAALVAGGRLKNVLLLLEHPAVLTLGRNGDRANVLASDELLAARGVTLHQINRGGDVTYHGPGQLVGYPIFDLRTLRGPGGDRMGPVDFVRGMEEALIRLCGGFGVAAGRVAGLTGAWCGNAVVSDQLSVISSPAPEIVPHQNKLSEPERKIGAIGIHVAKGITSHGFAFNVTTDLRDFDLIVPCGIPDHAVTSLERELAQGVELPELETVAHAAARQFGMVFEEQVLAVESLQALRRMASEAAREFPAEDTPVRVPEEIERLRGGAERPVQA